jgi:HTH-type transcriptional regulator/antitoxin HipB
VTVDEWLDEEMQDQEFRLLWREREAAYRVARELVRLRRAQGLSQSEVARRAGLKQPAVARLESGAAKPTLGTIQRVAHALGREVEVSLVPTEGRSRGKAGGPKAAPVRKARTRGRSISEHLRGKGTANMTTDETMGLTRGK